MRRPTVLICSLLTSGLPLLGLAAESGPDPARLVREVLAEVPLVDGHNDAPWEIREHFSGHLDRFDFRDTTTLDPPMHTDLERLRAGGAGAQFWSVWVPPELAGPEAARMVLEQIDLVKRLVARYPDELVLAGSAADIRAAHAGGKIASLIGMEGGNSIARSLAVLRSMYALGARYLTLTHWDTTAWADAATDAPEHGGLSPFGEEVVREMNRLGMMVDLAHVSAETMKDAIRVSRAPVIFSHSNAAALNPHPRNVPDEVLRLVAANNGIVMVNFGAVFVAESHVARWADGRAERARLEVIHPGEPEAVEQGMKAWYEAHPIPVVELAELADHMDHIRQVAGIDHLGMGSDFDGIRAVPRGLEDVSGYPALLEELARRGYSKEDLKKVAGENLLRVMSEVEAVAARLQASEEPRHLLFEESSEN